MPAEGRPSTHLLKPAHRFLAGSIPNELLCQRFAAAADVSAATTEMMAFAGEPALVSTRFDREFDASGVSRRLHQEDACQALMVLTVDLAGSINRVRARRPSAVSPRCSTAGEMVPNAQPAGAGGRQHGGG